MIMLIVVVVVLIYVDSLHVNIQALANGICGKLVCSGLESQLQED